MSLQKLLAQYPNFSARKIRRLAIQLQFLEGLDSPEAKGIASDLMALTMQAAKIEAQLSDVPDPRSEVPRNVVVVPSTEAIRALNAMAEDLQRNTGTLTSALVMARDIVHGSSFTAQDPRTEGDES